MPAVATAIKLGEKFMGAAAATDPHQPAGLPRWLSFERLTTVLSLAFSAGCLWSTLNAHSGRLDKLELRMDGQASFQVEVKTALATLMERTDPNHPIYKRP